jgi:hypothetical protein
MKTLAAVFILIVIGFFGQTFWLTVLNLAASRAPLSEGLSVAMQDGPELFSG